MGLPDICFLAPGSFAIGDRWIFLGRAEECQHCKEERFCHSGLRPGDVFLVTEDRKTRIYCSLRQDEVTTVGIRREMLAALRSKLVGVGAVMKYEPIRCNSLDCPISDVCSSGPPSGASIKIEEVVKVLECQSLPEKHITIVKVAITQPL